MGLEAFEEGMQIPANAAAPPSENTVWAHWAVAGHCPWLCGIQAQLPLLGVMTGPLLVLWASLVSVELTRGLMATEVPGKGWTGVEEDGARVGGGFWPALPSHCLTLLSTARNLSCFQCFKARRASQCHPMECQPSEKVCVSNEVLLYTSESFLRPEHLQASWQGRVLVPQPHPLCAGQFGKVLFECGCSFSRPIVMSIHMSLPLELSPQDKRSDVT